MKRKLQIFVSSTYTDLIIERQAAVETILRAGHIPAGMELFAAGDKSQLETINQWIDESDLYMLILGGRYGSIEQISGKSYTQLEYEYVVRTGKRFFAVVLSEGAIDKKVRDFGRSVIENNEPKKLQDFRSLVTSKICRIVDDVKDIKLSIHETIHEMLREHIFDGWVSGKYITQYEQAANDVTRLTHDVMRLTKENETMLKKLTKSLPGGGGETEKNKFPLIAKALAGDKISFTFDDGTTYNMTIGDWFLSYKNSFVSGISNSSVSSNFNLFLFSNIGSTLVIHGLAEHKSESGVRWKTLKTTKEGNQFLAFIQQKLIEKKSNNKAEKKDETNET